MHIAHSCDAKTQRWLKALYTALQAMNMASISSRSRAPSFRKGYDVRLPAYSVARGDFDDVAIEYGHSTKTSPSTRRTSLITKLASSMLLHIARDFVVKGIYIIASPTSSHRTVLDVCDTMSGRLPKEIR